MKTSRVPAEGGKKGTHPGRGEGNFLPPLWRGAGKNFPVPLRKSAPLQGGGKNFWPGRYENVTEAPRENREGHCERSEHGPTGFRGGPQCSRERWVPSGAHFWIFWPFFVVFQIFFAIYGILFAFFDVLRCNLAIWLNF